MKIAQLSSPWIALPPLKYGGTERVVSNLTEELVKRGHEVTVFATGDSRTSANLSYYYKTALSQDPKMKSDPLVWLHSFHECFKRAGEFDIVHNHMQHIGMFLADLVPGQYLHTIHGNIFENESPEIKRDVFKRFKNHNFVSISNTQRQGIPDLNYISTVYNGINPGEFEFGRGKGNYLAWIGRITPKKGLETAIETAKTLSIPLKISAYIDPVDMEYFNKIIEPSINGKFIEFLGELHGQDKTDFLKDAVALLFPVTWNEPFGLVMVEAMVCGTPVIAFNRGSVPEVVTNGVNGFIVENGAEMIEAVKVIGEINREKCRESVVDKFTVEKMVDGYEEAYKKILSQKSKVKSQKFK